MASPLTTAPDRRRWLQVLDLGRYLFDKERANSVRAFLLLLGTSLTEGFSLLLLVPIIQLASKRDGPIALHLPPPLSALNLAEIHIDLVVVLAGLVTLIVAQAFLVRAKSLHSATWLSGLSIRLRLQLLNAIAAARWEFVARQTPAKLQYTLTADVDRLQGAAYQLLLVVQHSVMLSVYVAASLFMSWQMTGFAAATGFVAFGLLAQARRRAFLLGEDMVNRGQEQSGVISEFLLGLKTAKSFGAESAYVGALSNSLSGLQNSLLQYARVSTSSAVAVQTVNAVALALFVLAAIQLFNLPLPTLIVLVFIFGRIAPRFQSVQRDVEQLLTATPAFSALQSHLAMFAENRAALQEAVASPSVLKSALEMRDVSFRYESAAGESLSQIDLLIPARQITAIIGPSGAGKSTFADLIMGLLTPTAGVILIDGFPLAPESAAAWRRHVAYVPQETFLLNGTVRANLMLGAADATEEQLWRALALANASDFVQRLPLGLDAQVGDRGAQLSGGERQRLALARALAREPELLVLDEATSSLDSENQAAIASTLELLRGRMTIITIAHRPSMIALADWVVVLEDGRITEAGAFSDLAGAQSGALKQALYAERAAS